MASKLSQAGVADLIVAHLEEIGVECVFGIPGGAIEPLFDALARAEKRGSLRVITARHETGAAFMADGYARESGRLGVCIATSGPGAANLITGLICAHENRIPVLAITGQPALPSFGRRAFQESGCTGVNIVGMFRHCTHYDTLISHPEQAETKTVSAITSAFQRRGAVHLAIPVDIQRSPAPNGWRSPPPGLRQMLRQPALLDEETVLALYEELQTAIQPVFVLGAGSARAARALLQVIERRCAPFITTPDAKGFIDPHHPLYHGVLGIGGHPEARELLVTQPDLIVAAGVTISEWSTANWDSALLNERLVHIDSPGQHMGRSRMARLHVLGELASIANRLLELDHAPGKIVPRQLPPARKRASAPEPVDAGVRPQVLMEALSKRCPPATRFVAEPGNSMAWAIRYLEPANPYLGDTARKPAAEESFSPMPAWLRVVIEFSPMGWAIGSAIGIAMARPGGPTVCITGDGAWLMNGQEVTVACQESLPVLFVILNDGALGMVKHGQRLNGAEPIGFKLPRVNFAALAEAMGVPGIVVHDECELAELDLDALLAREGPTVLDVRIDAEQIPPISLRLEMLRQTI